MKGTNLIKNSTFDLDLKPWVLYKEWIAVFDTAVVNGELKISIKTGSNQPWHVMLQHKTLPLTIGKSYHFTADARAEAPFNLIINLQTAPDPPTLHHTKTFALTTTMETYTWDFVSIATDPTTVMQLNMGGQGATTVYLDNIQFIEVTP